MMSEQKKYKLIRDGNKIGIQTNQIVNKKPLKPLFLDFSKIYRDFLRDNSLRNQILMRALGAKKGLRTVVDATAGFCGDSLLMLAAGFQVTAFEQSDIIFDLISQARSIFFELENQNIEKEKFLIFHSNALDGMNTNLIEAPEVIYLDPMFPKKKKSLSPKEMQVLQYLLPPPDEGLILKLFDGAIKFATQRVVVKRPLTAPPIVESPSHKFLGKSIRYDMYLV